MLRVLILSVCTFNRLETKCLLGIHRVLARKDSSSRSTKKKNEELNDLCFPQVQRMPQCSHSPEAGSSMMSKTPPLPSLYIPSCGGMAPVR